MKYIFITRNTLGVVPSDEMTVAYIGNIPDGKTPLHACEFLFEKFNIDHPVDYRGRSMSVGDVIAFPELKRFFLCESLGFKEITQGLSLAEEAKLF